MKIIVANRDELNIIHNINGMKYIIDPKICEYFYDLFIKDYLRYFKEQYFLDLEKMEVLPLKKINFINIYYRIKMKVRYIKYYRLHKKAKVATSPEAKEVEKMYEFMELIPISFFKKYLKKRKLFYIYKNNIYYFKIVNWFCVPDIIIYQIELEELVDICNNLKKYIIHLR